MLQLFPSTMVQPVRKKNKTKQKPKNKTNNIREINAVSFKYFFPQNWQFS